MKRIKSIGISMEPPTGSTIPTIHVYGTMYYDDNGMEKKYAPQTQIAYLDKQTWAIAASKAANILKAMIDHANEITVN